MKKVLGAVGFFVLMFSFIGLAFYLVVLIGKKGLWRRLAGVLAKEKSPGTLDARNSDRGQIRKTRKDVVTRTQGMTRLVGSSKVSGEDGLNKLNKRQRSLLGVLQKKGGASMSQIEPYFKDVTNRTLRRDLSKLENLGIIRQEGKTKNSFYSYAR